MWKAEQSTGTYYKERVRDPVTDKQHIVSVKVKGNTRLDYKNAQIALQAKIDALTWDSRKHRFSQVIEIYNREQAATLRPSTCHRNSSTLNTLLSILGDFEMDKVTTGYIKEKLVATGKEPVTINQYIKRLKGFLRWAYQNDYLKSVDVIEKLSYLQDTPHREKIKDKYLEPEELTALLDAMDVPRWKLLTEFLSLTGIRIGEAIALDKDDVYDDYIHVSRTVMINRKGVIGDAKTFDSIRDVSIQQELAECLREINTAMDEQAEIYEYPPTPYLFTGIDGERIEYGAYRKYLGQKSKSALGKTIAPHVLRHTHTSLLAAQGVPLDVISRRLGHSDSRVTRDIYMHVTKVIKMKDAERIANLRLLATPDATLKRREPLKFRL